MADITAALVKQLRDATNVSMMECKKALVEAEGDMDGATRLLRERGVAVAAKRAGKETRQGVIASATSNDGTTMSLVEVNCETDFVARNEDFQAFVGELAVKACDVDDGLAELAKDELNDKIAAIGENLKISRHTRYAPQGTGRVGSYIHLGGKVGVLVELGCEKSETAAAPDFTELLRDLTLHVAASAPRYLVPDEVDADEIASERAIYAKQVENKPPQIVDKIVDGKMKKYFAEVCFVEQGFVKEPKQPIKDLLAEKGKVLDDTLTIRRFTRYQLGA